MPLQATSGAASYDAFGGGVAVLPKYIEDYFSTFLYSGAGTTQTINNGVDLSAKGGLVWLKDRGNAGSHRLVDTVRGNRSTLFSESTSAAVTRSNDVSCDVSSFNSNGFTAGNFMNQASNNYVSWSIAKAPKFFDVVTYTGNGTASRAISHSLGSAPAMMIVKQTDGTRNWPVYHRSVPTGTGYLNLTSAFATGSGNGVWGDSSYNNIAPTSTVFYVGSDPEVNGNGLTYVAYLFAHNAGGFGLTGTDNVISCGSFTTNGSGIATVSLGYEPQWVLIKRTNDVDSWYISDNMRGMAVSGNQPNLEPDLSAAETAGGYNAYPNATGFTANVGIASSPFIYIAIRRGPMKVPTSGTSVFSPNATTASINTKITTNFPVDLQMQGYRPGFSGNIQTIDRLRGTGTVASSTSSVPKISTSSTAAESSVSAANGWDNTGFQISTGWDSNNMVYWNFQRAPSFFDEVCYTGTGSATTFSHNLGVAPELMIVKDRSTTYPWDVYHKDVGASAILQLNTTGATINTGAVWSNTTSTASVFSIGTNIAVNTSGNSYVWYGFATCAGVSKVGSYTGSDSDLNIDCGFTSGARFVMIKRTDASSDWYVWDSARGIVSGNDPRLSLNTTAAEVTDMNMINTYSAGFSVPAGGPNTGAGATFIYLAIA